MHETLFEDQKQAEIKRLTQCKKWKRQWRGRVKLPGDRGGGQRGQTWHGPERKGRGRKTPRVPPDTASPRNQSWRQSASTLLSRSAQGVSWYLQPNTLLADTVVNMAKGIWPSWFSFLNLLLFAKYYIIIRKILFKKEKSCSQSWLVIVALGIKPKKITTQKLSIMYIKMITEVLPIKQQ